MVAIAICVAVIGRGRMAAAVNVNQIVSADVNANQAANADVNVSQIVVVMTREAIIVQPYFLIRFHHVIQIADAVKTLVSREDSLQVQQPVVAKQRIDDDKEDKSLRMILQAYVRKEVV